jgi:hypothetical protein
VRACDSECGCAGLSAAVCALKKPRSSIACVAGALALQIRAKRSSELPCSYTLGFNASSCLSDRLTKVCCASVECLSRVRAGRLAFAAAAASQRRSPRRPAAVFTPSVTVPGPWELARSASSHARSLLGCDLVLTRPCRFRSDAVYGRAALPARNFAGVLCTPKVACCRSRRNRRRLRRVAPPPPETHKKPPQQSGGSGPIPGSPRTRASPRPWTLLQTGFPYPF